jgi:hypothetical protein
MKKVLMVALALLISIAFVSSGIAQSKEAPEKATQEKVATEKTPAPEKAPAAKKAPTQKKRAPKPKAEAQGFVGKVAMIDAILVVVKGKKATVTFDAANPMLKGYKTIGDVMVGDTVAAKYTKDGVMITKLKGTAKTKAVGEKKVEKAKKAPKKEAVSQITCTETEPCATPVSTLTEVRTVRLFTCKGTAPCTVSVDKLTE